MEKPYTNNMNNPSINVYQNIPAQNMRQPVQNMGQPIIIAQPIQPSQYVVPIANNQVYAVNLYDNIFKLEPVLINCPFCRQTVTTTVEPTFSCCACCICMFTGLLIFLCIQLIRDKEICCQDATHYCPNCNNKVGIYKAI
jgi:hypothetical protein